MRRGDLARALAERSRGTGQQLTEGQAQDELDRMVYAIVTSLRRGRCAEMPGVGTMTALVPTDEKPGPSFKPTKRKMPVATSLDRRPGGKSKS